MSLRGRGAKKDFLATERAKILKLFRCKGSFVAVDGREFLSRGDWQRRVAEIFERDKRQCQWVIMKDFYPGIPMLCGKRAQHPHHIIPKGKGGDDSLGNLMAICAIHHKEAHPEKQTKWSKKEKP